MDLPASVEGDFVNPAGARQSLLDEAEVAP
jgi:hypothetical protein